MSSFDINGFDEYTNKMLNRLSKEYPQTTKKFLERQIQSCKNEAINRTPKADKKPKQYRRSKHLKDSWKTQVRVNSGKTYAILKNDAPHSHLIENGHITKNGGWWEGKHMLENTMTSRQPKIDAAIDRLIDEIFDF